MTALRVLVVDDDVDLAESFAELLESQGHEVTAVHSGERAVEVFDAARFDVVFMDVKLPGMNGVESFLAIRRKDAEARVIMMTAFRLGDLLSQAIVSGALAVLHKPFDFDQVFALLEEIDPAGVVLIADDDDEFTACIEEVLVAKGYRVFIARTGTEAVAIVLGGRIDLLVLDLRLPELAGAEVYREIKRVSKPPQTIVVTGYPEEEAEQMTWLREIPVESCLTKPIDPGRLLDLIGQAMR